MRTWARIVAIVALVALVIAPAFGAKPGDKGKPGGESAGNNLSYPVLWAEGVEKTLRGDPGDAPELDGTFWYWWGTDEAGNPLSCLSDTDGPDFCDDNVDDTVGPPPGDGAVKVYPQQDAGNTWQAGSLHATGGLLEVDWIDWGDNLESVDWSIRSQVRTEVVLINDLDTPLPGYDMRHLYGWGIDEMWGLATTTEGDPAVYDGYQATVYSHCAHLYIQRLLVDQPDDPSLSCLEWQGADVGWTCATGDVVNAPLFEGAVWAGADGPGYYSAEINVKGKIIYGYTWNVRNANDGVGLYRLTFAFDSDCGGVALNTSIANASIVPISEEEEVVVLEEEGGDTGGGTPHIDAANNLTYIDIRIVPKTGGRP